MKKTTRRPKPRKISLEEWSQQFRLLDWGTIKRYRYFNNGEWGTYLAPPATFMAYGMRELKRLKFDNSLTALRMWSFVLGETERLFRARQAGKKIIATMGDLGAVPVLVMAFPDCISFCPELIWREPFIRESKDLLETAYTLGAPEAACIARAALAAFHKRSYFPQPDLLIASTGASCDDYSCVMQLVEDIGQKMLWVEIPLRRESRDNLLPNARTKDGAVYQPEMEKYLIAEYKRIWQELFRVTGVNNPHRLEESIRKTNQLRRLVGEIKSLACDAAVAPLAALELMAIEFGNLHGYADLDEWVDILTMMKQTVKDRIARGTGILKESALPIAWISSATDPYLFNLVESYGCRVVATEYMINQALVEIEEDIEPMLAIARSFINGSLIGSTAERIRKIKDKIREKKIKGVLITTSPGASHCSMETKLIEKLLGDVPVLAIDVPEPLGILAPLKTRIKTWVETIK